MWTEAAATDLEQAAEYIARDSPRYAAAFVREVRAAARGLADLAQRGRIVLEFGDPAVCEIFVRSYRLLYHLSPNAISVIGLIHGARDLAALWKRERRQPPDGTG